MSDRHLTHASVSAVNFIFAVMFTVAMTVTPGLIGPFGLNVVRVLSTDAVTWVLLPIENGAWRAEGGHLSPSDTGC